MKIVVCGGRDFVDYDKLSRRLNALHENRPIELLVHGGARGADFLAGQWAEITGVKAQVVKADWTAHGKKAGFLRNLKMLEDYKPEMVVAFRGGKGKERAHMVEIAKRARIRTLQIW